MGPPKELRIPDGSDAPGSGNHLVSPCSSLRRPATSSGILHAMRVRGRVLVSTSSDNRDAGKGARGFSQECLGCLPIHRHRGGPARAILI